MKKITLFIYVIFASLLVSCETSNPAEKKQLIGTWSEPYHVNNTVKSITFNNNDTLVYADKPDTTWNVVIDWGGQYARLRYIVNNHRLSISGERKDYDYTTGKIVREPFAFSTAYSIEGNVLTLDSFSYDGGLNSRYYKPVILYKQ